MEVFYRAAPLQLLVSELKKKGNSIGFVPTMGALHEGHLSLVRTSAGENNITIASIFVNPTQFNDKDDLKRYPRTPEKDVEMLRSAGCNMVFMPDVEEIYPEPDTRVFDFGGLDKVMEGKQRPGHFNGVAQVVTRLFDLVAPSRAYFGLKDFQQVAIIKKVIADLHYPVKIVACPIVREPDGLAMSSRNMLLSADERKKALILSQSLFQAKNLKHGSTPAVVTAFVTGQIKSTEDIKLEYFEIIDGATLLRVNNWGDHADVLGCIAVSVGKIRLIDNVNFS
jgi:pantoate--beta-alanine ligase